MTDRRALTDPNETPEDVATLYSWANLHGAKYRDFSASRAQTREKARQRVQEAIESERRRAREEAEAQKQAEELRAVEEVRTAEAERQAEIVRENAARLAKEAAEREAQEVAQRTAATQRQWHSFAPANPPAAAGAPGLPYSAAAPSYAAPQVPAPQYGAFSAPASYMNAPIPPAYPPQQAQYFQNRPAWVPAAEPPARPAWLAERADAASPAYQQAPEDTLQGSRDRLTSRWFALKSVFSHAPAAVEAAPVPSASHAPVLAVFSLAGGVGKTSIVATLGRALSARGERVLLVDTAAFGLLPFFFGARDQRPGVLRTFTPPGPSGDAPIQMMTLDPEVLGLENAPQEVLTSEIARNAGGASRVIVDLATASGSTTRRVLRMSPTVLVPVVPDMSSVVSVSSIDAFFRHNNNGAGQQIMPYYVLNQFDPSLPLHLDVREVLREQLGERLLPFALRRTPSASEALAEGMTVMDYAPNSTLAEDFATLAGWVKSLAAPASQGFRGVRWSER